jgi:ribose 1,5-bisphosphate isomerase
MRQNRPVLVVTAFLTHDHRVLLVRRSERVGTYRGAWAGISGYVERLPLDQAYVEISEEAGLPREDLRLRGIGVPIAVEDTDLGRTWLVFPFLFEVLRPDSAIFDWEAEEVRWVCPEEIIDLRTVPGLVQALESVWPPFGDAELWTALASIATDTVRGATHLALAALGAVGEYLNRVSGVSAARAARALAACRPSMGVFPHLAARLLRGDTAIGDLRDALTSASAQSADRAAEALADHRRVLTISYSTAVRDAILRRHSSGDALEVVVAESRPEMEGAALAADLAEAGVKASVITDAQAGLAVEEADCVLVGCDAITTDDMVQNKAGTRLLVLAARSCGVPCFAVTQTQKIVPPGFPLCAEEQDPARVGRHEGVRFRNVVFDRTPLSMLDAVHTENGVLTLEDLNTIRSGLDTVHWSW